MKKIQAIILEPGKEAYVKEIGRDLASMQQIVGGLIQAVYPFEEEVCIVVNDEGKITGLPLNRALFDENGKVYDIIAGTAVICSCKTEYFGSLTEKEQEKYLAMFKSPETFISIGGEILAIPIDGE